MGVMLCDRNGCDGLHSRTLNLGKHNGEYDTRYICSDCMIELDKIIDALPSTMKKSEVNKKIREFFATEKGDEGPDEDVNPGIYLHTTMG